MRQSSRIDQIQDHQRHVQLQQQQSPSQIHQPPPPTKPNKFVSSYNVLLRMGLMSRDQMRTLCSSIQKCYQLQTIALDFSESQLDSEGLFHLSSALKNHKKLMSLSLDLADNKIDPVCWQSLGQTLQTYTFLPHIELSFWRCGLTKQCLENIFRLKEDSSNVELMTAAETLVLDFQYNKIGEEGALHIQSIIESGMNLTNLTLHLWNNRLGDFGAQRIARGVVMAKNLQILNLNLSCNRISIEGCRLMCVALSVLSLSITQFSLNIAVNTIQTKGCEYIGDVLFRLKELKNLNLILNSNCIGEKGFLGLIDKLDSLPELMSLSIDLSENPEVTKENLILAGENIRKNYIRVHTVMLYLNDACIEEQFNSYYEANERLDEAEMMNLETQMDRKTRRERTLRTQESIEDRIIAKNNAKK